MAEAAATDGDKSAQAKNQEAEEEEWKVQLQAHKLEGDTAFRSGDFSGAIRHYSDALTLDPSHATLLSNRSAAYLKNNEKSKALHDAQKIGDRMGVKGFSRLAAALQSLGRYEQALKEWDNILRSDPQHKAALDGSKVCSDVLEKQKNDAENDQETEKADQEEEVDELDDFFNEVEDVAEATKREQFAEPVATEAILHHKKDLGSVKEQVDRLLGDKYEWRNLNPFHVLDLSHESSNEEIARRYKAISLLLHPDKNRNNDTVDQDRLQLAFDEVLQAKAKLLQDENKANHVRQLCEEGTRQGKEDFEKLGGDKNERIRVAIQKIFATAEYNRRQVEERTRNHEKREREQEDEEKQKLRKERDFNESWKQEGRVDKRIGNWRDFATKKKSRK